MSDDLAFLLAAHNVSDVHAPFAQDWRFDLIMLPDGQVRIDLPPSGQDELLSRRTGWRPRWRPMTSVEHDAPQWQRELDAGNPVLLIGDSFHLPWLPYAGHEHAEHGFVLVGLGAGGHAEGGGYDLAAHIVDPYDNVTEWGAARPVVTQLPLHALAPALPGGRWAVLVRATPEPQTSPAEQVASNATAILAAAAQGSYQRFITSHREAGLDQMRRLSLQTWLLARNRMLHVRWLAGLPSTVVNPALAQQFDAEIADGWQRAMQMSYIALRRVRSGRTAPGAAFSAIEAVASAEASLAHSMLSKPTASPSEEGSS